MHYSTTISSAPAVEPVTAEDMHSHAVITIDDDDTELGWYIETARQVVEVETNRQLITATWKMYLDSFPGVLGCIRVPYPPLQSITSITYYDAAGDLQTLSSDDYQVDTDAEPGRIIPEPGEVWPTTEHGRLQAVTITYKAGFGDAATDVPQSLKQAIMMLTAHYYEHREALTEVQIRELPLPGSARLLMIHETVPG